MAKNFDIKDWLTSVKNTVLYPLFKSYLGKDTKYSLSLEVGDMSYCCSDGSIVVGLTKEETDTLDVSDLLRILKFKMYHECSHALYTHDGLYEVCKKSMVNIWAKEAKKKDLYIFLEEGDTIANWLLNSLEDGRIENIMCNQKKGLIKHRNWYRIREWEKSPLSSEWGDMTNTLNALLDIATMGIYPKGFEAIYSDESRVKKVVNSCIPNVGDFVKSAGLTEAKKHSDKIALKISELVIDEIAVTKEEYDKGQKRSEEKTDRMKSEMENNSNNFKAEKGSAGAGKNGPIIGIITDDNKGTSNNEKDPDYIIDLRKNPPKETGENTGKGAGGGRGAEKKSDSNISDSNSGGNGGAKGSTPDNTPDKTTKGNRGEEGEKTGDMAGKKMGEDVSVSSQNSTDSTEIDPVEKALEDVLKDIEEETREKIKKEIERAEGAFNKAEEEQKDSETKLNTEELKNLGVSSENFDEFSSFTAGKGVSTTPEALIKSRAARTARRLKNIIASKSVTERNELYDGSFDTDALGRFVTGRSDIFKTPARKTDPDMCCYILKDNSGSMQGGNKEEQAINACIEIEEIFKSLVPIKITAFSSLFGNVEHVVIKDWKDREKNKSYSASYHEAGNTPHGSNNDAMSIRIAAEELIKRPEKNKVLIVVSDGLPADCSEEDVNRAVKAARKKGIFLISFFIGSEYDRETYFDNYKAMYEKYFSCVDPKDLGNRIVVIMKELFKKL